MKIMMIHPGPDFSVADVFNGWYKALKKQGHQVQVYNTNDRLTFYDRAWMPDPTKPRCNSCNQQHFDKALEEPSQVIQLAMAGICANAYTWWPDMIFFISGFYTSPQILQVLKAHGHKIVMLHTESPYQDEEQFKRGRVADLNLLNDPTNLDIWRDQGVNTHYMPHSYDPDIHYPGNGDYEYDFSFIGSPFPSRQKFFNTMDFTGFKVALGGGGWNCVADEYRSLQDYLVHDPEMSVDNDETAKLYRMSKVGINIYRREGETEGQEYEGYSMGPREVEMAASGLFFLRDHRPESDEVFGAEGGDILPSFESPEHATELLRYWVKHDTLREKFADRARERIADWTFDNRAAQLMELIKA